MSAKVVNDREADFIVCDGTEEDAKNALERCHGSSSAAMLLEISTTTSVHLKKFKNLFMLVKKGRRKFGSCGKKVK